jgi:hypothetical protein
VVSGLLTTFLNSVVYSFLQDLLMVTRLVDSRPSLRVSFPLIPANQSNCDGKPYCFPVQCCGQSRIARACVRQLCRRRCRELCGCISKNYPPKTPSRTATSAPPFFSPLPPNHPLPCHPWACRPIPLTSCYGPSASSSQQHYLLPTLTRKYFGR